MDPRLALASAYLTLNLPFGPGSGPPPSLEFGLHPSVRLGPDNGTYTPGSIQVSGMATPMGYGYTNTATSDVHREELAHIDQMEALGPAFFLAYALTGGEPFEPYRAREGDFSVDFNRMWNPEEAGMGRNFPQFRMNFGESPSLEVLPGYGEALSVLWELISGGK